MSSSLKKIYNKRIGIEHCNNIFKSCRRCICRYDKNIDTFEGSVYMSLISYILNFIKY